LLHYALRTGLDNRTFAIGDTAASNGWAGAAVPGLAPAAKQQGRHVAHVIRAAIKGHPSPGTFRYRHYGNLATIGRLAAVVELRWFRLWGAPAWWFWGIAMSCFSPADATAPPSC